MADVSEQDSAATTPGVFDGVVTRVRSGMGAMSLNAVLSAITQLAIVPVALLVWGKFRYGEWVLLTGLVSFLKLTDLGIQTWVVNRLCACDARGEHEEFQRLLHSALRVQAPLAAGVLVVVTAVTSVLPMSRILGLQTIAGFPLEAVLVLLSAELLLGVPTGVITGVYRATGRLSRGAMLGSAQQTAVLLATIALIAGHSGFTAVAAGRVIVAVLVTLWAIRDIQRLHPWLHLRITSGSWRDGLAMIPPGLLFMLIPVADFLSTQVMLVLTQRSLGGGEVSRFATHRTIVNLSQMVSLLLINAVWPEITSLHARAEHARLQTLHRSLTRLTLWIVAASTLGVLPFLRWVYPSWTAGKLSLDYWVLAALIARQLLWGAWYPSLSLMMAINRHYRVTIVVVAGALAASVLAVFLIPAYGIRGPAWALLIADACTSAWIIPRITCRTLQERLLTHLGAAAKAAVAIVLPLLVGLAGWWAYPGHGMFYGVFYPLSLLLAVGLVLRQLSATEWRGLRRLWPF